MASPPGQNPVTYNRTKVENPIEQAKWAYLTKGPNAPLNILAKDASYKAQILAGMAKNDPEAQKKFFGHTPTAADWAKIKGGPASYNISGKGATQTAAQGGLMALRGYADGGKAGNKPLDSAQIAFINKMAQKMQNKEALTEAEKTRLNTIEQKTGRNVSPYTDVGTTAVSNKKAAAAVNAINSEYSDPNPQNPASNNYGKPADGSQPANAGLNPVDWTNQQIIGFNPNPDANDPYAGVTNPFYQKAIDQMNNMKMPEEYGQASGYFNQAAQGLGGLANYSPQQVAAQQASAERASAQQASAAQMAAIADVNAERVNLGQYNINAAQMAKAKDVEAKQLERYQMDQTAPVTTQDLTAYQMEGPGSWTDEGVSSKYMSPYMQGVIDISKREAERDYQKQMNALNAKSMAAGAFGGAGQALERAEAQRNYNQQLQDMQVKGLQQAYESGRSQYGQELSLSQQAALSNLQSKLSTQSQSSQQALQAMLSNQNIDYQTKLQNLQAMLGVQSQEAQQMLNASLANQQSENLYNQTNAQLAQQAALANQGISAQGDLANQQAALNAALANQQTQFGVGSLNANLANQVNLQNANLGTQAAMQNAQLGTQTSWQNAANALQASMANQAAGLQANQQGIAAYGAMGNMASGLGSIGNNIAGYNQQTLNNWGGMGNTWQSGMTDAARQAQINAYNAANPANPIMPVVNAVGNVSGTPSTSTTTSNVPL